MAAAVSRHVRLHAHQGAASEAALERALPRCDRARAGSATSTQCSAGEPHLAGSARDYTLMAPYARPLHRVRARTGGGRHSRGAAAMAGGSRRRDDRARSAGARRCAEDPVAEDPDTAIMPQAAGIPYHAYSASGDVTALRGPRRQGRTRRTTPHSSAGAWTCAEGSCWLCVGSLQLPRLQSADGTAAWRGRHPHLLGSGGEERSQGGIYPDGPRGPESGIQRGGVAYDFIVPGDPLTPGGRPCLARRAFATSRRAVAAANHQRSALLSGRADDPRCDEPDRPHARRGRRSHPAGLDRHRDHSRQPRSLTQLVIVGNHRDAWIYGGVDPSSGSAALMELARGLGALAPIRVAAEAVDSVSRAGTPKSSRSHRRPNGASSMRTGSRGMPSPT